MNFNVTLAYAKTNKKLTLPAFQQPKLDGIRCYFTKDGAFSRNHKKFMNLEHIEMSLVDFFETNPDIILDGELYNHRLKNDFEKIVSLVRKQKPSEEDRLAAAGLIEYHIYDLFDQERPDLVQFHRTYTLDKFFETYLDKPFLVSVPTFNATSDEEIKTYNERCLKDGYEGTMLRSLLTPYAQKRSYDLQKVKQFKDAEATIIAVVEGKGKLTGHMGKFMMRDAEGHEFGAPPGGESYASRKAMWENRSDYIGLEATYTYFEKTKYGKPRFPLFKAVRNYE